ncbi:hypothetical protein CONPUDRAFT_75395 [Coniophora puteana RWD-64-598 SS2]|uniref:Uncharacterized protein n=1 Tax=Coniophora puteana (strain RWD-64-598) TaxID=741705 RepID=A0A5M3ME83_CONPW|nr:uncharacterized protein CONPUDRAFT_75395 [Coniophora puteana RWD-64-598 SS2]EIW77532.1 hypothetical protein CONPUDRAFT_75395 [Coniophora puteana RWD-64-598 SS2]
MDATTALEEPLDLEAERIHDGLADAGRPGWEEVCMHNCFLVRVGSGLRPRVSKDECEAVSRLRIGEEPRKSCNFGGRGRRVSLKLHHPNWDGLVQYVDVGFKCDSFTLNPPLSGEQFPRSIWSDRPCAFIEYTQGLRLSPTSRVSKKGVVVSPMHPIRFVVVELMVVAGVDLPAEETWCKIANSGPPGYYSGSRDESQREDAAGRRRDEQERDRNMGRAREYIKARALRTVGVPVSLPACAGSDMECRGGECGLAWLCVLRSEEIPAGEDL